MATRLLDIVGVIGSVAAVYGLNSLLQRAGRPTRKGGLSAPHKAILAKYAIHYQRLDEAGQQRMERITAAFLGEKEWVGAGMAVKEEQKVMISACAAQLLMGFPDLVLQHFERIIVYPDTYRSPKSGRMHQGEVRPKPGIIIISWEDFVHGYAHSRDAHNVGLHELAHALWFEDRTGNQDLIRLDKRLMARWRELAKAEAARIHAGNSSLFRDYAGTNQEEFFAVAVEYFFEQPAEFRQALPELYATMAGLLKQDPAKGVSPNGTSTAR
jgi:hypothetical protein